MSTLTFPNTRINEFEEFQFIGGSYKELTFYVNNSSGSPIDISYMTANWTLSPYNFTDYISLSKTGICYNGVFTIQLMKDDTKNLSGKYIQRAFLTGVPNYEQRIGQGIVYIIAGIGMDNYV